MNKQYFEDHTNTSVPFDESDEEENTSVENLDFSSNNDPALVAFERQLPVGSVPPPDVDSVEATIIHEASSNEKIPSTTPVDVPIKHENPAVPKVGSSVTLFDPGESEHLRSRWNEIQGAFVDGPRLSVQQADALVSDVIEKIRLMFAHELNSLENEWKQGNGVTPKTCAKFCSITALSSSVW